MSGTQGSLLLVNARLLIQDAFRVSENAAIYVEGGTIRDIGPTSEVRSRHRADRVIDLSGKLAMPGLVDSHNHLCEGHQWSLVALDEEMTREELEGLDRYIFAAWAWLKPETAHDMVSIGLLNSLKNGTTTVNDCSIFPDSMGEAAEASGMRVVLCPQLMTHTRMPDCPSPDQYLAQAARAIRRWHGAAGGRLQVMVHPHTPYSCTDEILRDCVKLARDEDVGLAIHVAEAPFEMATCPKTWGEDYMTHIEKLGLMGPRSLFFHCIHLNDADIAALARTGTAVAHSPWENGMMLKAARVPELRAAGVKVGLATDNPSGDLMHCMSLAVTMHNVIPEHGFVSPHDSFHMATQGSADAMGLGDRVGSLDIGKRADIIAIDLSRNARLYNTMKQSVISDLVQMRLLSSGQVETVIVEGEVLLEGGKPTRVDEIALLARGRQVTEDFIAFWHDARRNGRPLVERLRNYCTRGLRPSRHHLRPSPRRPVVLHDRSGEG